MKALVMLVGPPGSRKSDWAQARFEPPQIVSVAELYDKLADAPGDADATKVALEIRRTIVAQRMERGLLTVADDYTAEPLLRHKLISPARRANLPVIVVSFTQDGSRCPCPVHCAQQRLGDPAEVERITDMIVGGSVDLAGTSDITIIVGSHGEIVRISGDRRAIPGFENWRDELRMRAALAGVPT